MKKTIFLLALFFLPLISAAPFNLSSIIVNNQTVYCSNATNYTAFPSNSTLNQTCSNLTLIGTGLATQNDDALNLYYLIPIIMTIVMILILVILIVIAKLLEVNRRKHQLKPITGLQSAQV